MAAPFLCHGRAWMQPAGDPSRLCLSSAAFFDASPSADTRLYHVPAFFATEGVPACKAACHV